MPKPVLMGLCAYLLVALAVLAVPPGRPAERALISVATALGDDGTRGYQRAYAPRPFVFPADHGPHEDFRNEWWYVTGNVRDARGRAFGYQLTLFRIALTPKPVAGDSAWRAKQLYMGHFAVTDVKGQRHYGFDRFSRAALGLAGAQAAPFRVWLEDWSLSGGGGDAFPLRVRAREGAIALDLSLEPAKPIVSQGDRGLSQKSDEPGNASYYYSSTRLRSRGTLTVAGDKFNVTGLSWLDREWSTSALGPEQAGWDWFALHLDDGRDLMFYRLRLKNGGTDPHSGGVLVGTDGATRRLGRDDVELRVLSTWTSPRSGDRYPSGWSLRVPAERLDLTIVPRVDDQEMRLAVRYWEGAVAVTGRAGERPVNGVGYLEMTRYGGATAP